MENKEIPSITKLKDTYKTAFGAARSDGKHFQFMRDWANLMPIVTKSSLVLAEESINQADKTLVPDEELPALDKLLESLKVIARTMGQIYVDNRNGKTDKCVLFNQLKQYLLDNNSTEAFVLFSLFFTLNTAVLPMLIKEFGVGLPDEDSEEIREHNLICSILADLTPETRREVINSLVSTGHIATTFNMAPYRKKVEAVVENIAKSIQSEVKAKNESIPTNGS
jgi:hypothetical protein